MDENIKFIVTWHSLTSMDINNFKINIKGGKNMPPTSGIDVSNAEKRERKAP
jgi:hypothetical protein